MSEGGGYGKRARCPACTSSDRRRHTDDELRQFHPERWEFEEATRELKFTKDFNPALEAIMRDPLATIVERVLAWIKRRAWGNFHLYCVKDNGEPAFQVDCAAELGVNKRRVSDAVRYLAARGYVAMRATAKMLYPVICPRLSGPPPGSTEKSEEYRTFLQFWKVAHSADFMELEVARSTVVRLRKVLLSEYKQWRASRTESGVIKEESLRDSERTGSPSAAALCDNSAPVAAAEKLSHVKAEVSAVVLNSPTAVAVAENPSHPKPITPAVEPEVAMLTEALAGYDPLAEPAAAKGLLEACRRNAPHARPPVQATEVLGVCREKLGRNRGLENIRNPIGFFLETVPPCFPRALAALRGRAASSTERPTPTPAERAEEPVGEPARYAAMVVYRHSRLFEQWWAAYPLNQHQREAAEAWSQLVTVDNEGAVLACTTRYLASDQVARGVVMNPDKWLWEQSRNGWEGKWPPRQLTKTDQATQIFRERMMDRSDRQRNAADAPAAEADRQALRACDRCRPDGLIFTGGEGGPYAFCGCAKGQLMRGQLGDQYAAKVTAEWNAMQAGQQTQAI